MSNDPTRIYSRAEGGRFRTRALRRTDGSVQLTVSQPDGTVAADVLSREERIELARALLADIEPAPVYAVCEYHYCDGEGLDGQDVVELYTSKQTAEQHVDRNNRTGYVTKLTPRTKLREY